MASTRLQRAFFEGRFTRGYARKIRTRAVSRARQIVSVFPEEIHPPDLVDSHLCGMDTSREDTARVSASRVSRIERTTGSMRARPCFTRNIHIFGVERPSVRPRQVSRRISSLALIMWLYAGLATGVTLPSQPHVGQHRGYQSAVHERGAVRPRLSSDLVLSAEDR